jgi:hypothetical protein
MKLIPLTQDMNAIVDDADYETLSQFKWSVFHSGGANRKYYAQRSPHPKHQTILMHRMLMDYPGGMEIDHINGNGLDNRKCNLRICSKSQNMANRGKTKRNQSGAKGIIWDKANQRWMARIAIQRKTYFLGRFERIEDARSAYARAAQKYFGEFARSE